MDNMDSKVVIYTDGACSGNPGPGGWGALLKFNDASKKIFGYELVTTNNRMEMTAALEALRVLKKSSIVEIYTDSKYLQHGITVWIHNWMKNNWCKNNNEPVKNVDLWQKLYSELSKHTIMWRWVKGHASNSGNIAADKLAVQGRETAMEILKCRG
nr:ribonuclease HI [Rickettsia typhi]